MFEIPESPETSHDFGVNGIGIRIHVSPIWHRTRFSKAQVSSVVLADPLLMFYGNLSELDKNVKLGNKVQFHNEFTS